VAVVRDVHRAGGVTLLSGGPACPATSLGDRPLILASGLGNPRGFELAARLHGWHVVASWRYPDHHAFTASDVTALATACREHHAELVVTAKDAVKLAALAPTVRTWVLAAGDQLDESGLADLDRALDPHFPNRT
jgi:tetraacyldisaccharide 4'-kinase